MMGLMGLTRAVMDEYLEGRIVGMPVNWRELTRGSGLYWTAMGRGCVADGADRGDGRYKRRGDWYCSKDVGGVVCCRHLCAVAVGDVWDIGNGDGSVSSGRCAAAEEDEKTDLS